MRLFSAVLAVAASLVFAGSVQAAQLFQATFTGTVVPGGFDFDNRFGFGTGFSALDLRTFSLVVIYDPTLGNARTTATFEDRRGGTTVGPNVDSPVLSAALTILGGNTVTLIPDQFGQIRSVTNNGFSVKVQDLNADGGPLYDDLAITASYPASGHLNSTLALTNVTGGANLMLFNNGAQRGSVVMQLGTAKYEILNTAGVPEPTSWALMIVGLGGVGAALRGRRRESAVAA